MIRRLDNAVRHYSWGSTTHLPRLTGRPADGSPWAELWMGAHPGDPSRTDGERLDTLIARDPERLLGPSVRRSFGDRLPYLLKLLAAAEPLSLQVHPSSEHARIRHAQQEALGIAMDAPERSYQDASHKPELLYALTRFEGMAGFRDTAKSATILRGLDVDWLDDVADRIESTPTPFQTLRDVVTDLLATTGVKLEGRLQQLRAAATAADLASHRPTARERPPVVGADDVARESLRVYAALVPLIDRYPRDAGVLVTLLLNHVVLPAGSAMFVDAGVIHAYTSGLGVEVMASSDNVVRAGLTTKHVDIPELLRIADFTPVPPPLWAPRRSDDGRTTVLAPPVDEFALTVLDLDGEPAELLGGPRIACCLEGSVDLTSGDDKVTLARGESAFVDAGEDLSLSGHGRVVVAATP